MFGGAAAGVVFFLARRRDGAASGYPGPLCRHVPRVRGRHRRVIPRRKPSAPGLAAFRGRPRAARLAAPGLPRRLAAFFRLGPRNLHGLRRSSRGEREGGRLVARRFRGGSRPPRCAAAGVRRGRHGGCRGARRPPALSAPAVSEERGPPGCPSDGRHRSGRRARGCDRRRDGVAGLGAPRGAAFALQEPAAAAAGARYPGDGGLDGAAREAGDRGKPVAAVRPRTQPLLAGNAPPADRPVPRRRYARRYSTTSRERASRSPDPRTRSRGTGSPPRWIAAWWCRPAEGWARRARSPRTPARRRSRAVIPGLPRR